MQPALPDEPDHGPRSHPGVGPDEPAFLEAEVGPFTQGTAFSRWALARYLVGQAIAASVSQTLLFVAVVVLVLAALAGWGAHLTWLAVLLVLLALGVLLVRFVLRAVLRRFTDAARYSPVAGRLSELVSDTHHDVLAELRRLGLPSHTVTLPLLAFRFLGRRRPDTVERLRHFDTDRAVPAARIDELHMLLRHGDAGGGVR